MEHKKGEAFKPGRPSMIKGELPLGYKRNLRTVASPGLSDSMKGPAFWSASTKQRRQLPIPQIQSQDKVPTPPSKSVLGKALAHMCWCACCGCLVCRMGKWFHSSVSPSPFLLLLPSCSPVLVNTFYLGLQCSLSVHSRSGCLTLPCLDA